MKCERHNVCHKSKIWVKNNMNVGRNQKKSENFRDLSKHVAILGKIREKFREFKALHP